MLNLEKLLGRLRPAKPCPVAAAPPAPEARPMPAAAHWQAVEDVLQGSIGSAEAARRLHQAAARQIDSTHYALSQLMSELAAVMTFPARPSAVVIPVRVEQPAAAAKAAFVRKQRSAA